MVAGYVRVTASRRGARSETVSRLSPRLRGTPGDSKGRRKRLRIELWQGKSRAIAVFSNLRTRVRFPAPPKRWISVAVLLPIESLAHHTSGRAPQPKRSPSAIVRCVRWTPAATAAKQDDVPRWLLPAVRECRRGRAASPPMSGRSKPNSLPECGSSSSGCRATGNLAHDAHIAALLREHGVREFFTADKDFSRFPGIAIRNPFATDEVHETRVRYRPVRGKRTRPSAR